MKCNDITQVHNKVVIKHALFLSNYVNFSHFSKRHCFTCADSTGNTCWESCLVTQTLFRRAFCNSVQLNKAWVVHWFAPYNSSRTESHQQKLRNVRRCQTRLCMESSNVRWSVNKTHSVNVLYKRLLLLRLFEDFVIILCIIKESILYSWIRGYIERVMDRVRCVMYIEL